METDLDRKIVDMIVKDKEIRATLISKIYSEIEKVDIGDIIQKQVEESLEYIFEDLDLKDAIEKPLQQLIKQTLMEKFKN